MGNIGTRVPNSLRELEIEPTNVQTKSRAGGSPKGVTIQIVLQFISTTLTAEDAWKSNCLVIPVGCAPAIDNSFHKHQAVTLSVL